MTRALHRLIQVAAAAVFLFFSASPASARDKSDVITLANGDRITGEIIELKYGQLTVKTDSLGTVAIEWLDVARIESPFSFSVEVNDGHRYSGNLSPGSESGHFVVTTETGTADLNVHNVSRLSQLEAGFIERLTGSVSLGFDETKSSGVSRLSFGFDAEYRSEKNVASLDGNFTSNDNGQLGTFNQYSLTYLHQFLRPGDKFWMALASYESNEQQGIDGRLLLGGARGKYLIRRDVAELSTYAGVSVTQEWATESTTEPADDVQGVEALFGLEWKIFKFKHPETSLTSRLMLFPSLTETGRYRARTDITLRHEIVKDFYTDLSFTGAYDSDPPTIGAESMDYTVSTSLGYKF